MNNENKFPLALDTPFSSDKMWNTNAYKTNKPVSAFGVAKRGAELLLNGKGKKVVGFISNLPRITPDRIMMKIKKNWQARRTKVVRAYAKPI